jgi:glycerophosphoryl diester phosphodiesterase
MRLPAANRWREPKAIHIAHQGGENAFPSNTTYAFKRAVRAGADMLELDIGVTRDGAPTARGTPGTPGSGTTTATSSQPGAASSPCAWTAS